MPFIKLCHVHFITNLTHTSEFQVISPWHLSPSFKQSGSLSGDSKPVNRGPGAGTAEEQTRDPTQEMISRRGSLRHSPASLLMPTVYLGSSQCFSVFTE